MSSERSAIRGRGSRSGMEVSRRTSSSWKTGARSGLVTTSTSCPAAARARSRGSWARPWEALPVVVHRTRMGWTLSVAVTGYVLGVRWCAPSAVECRRGRTADAVPPQPGPLQPDRVEEVAEVVDGGGGQPPGDGLPVEVPQLRPLGEDDARVRPRRRVQRIGGEGEQIGEVGAGGGPPRPR